MDNNYDVFISYSSKDEAAANAVCDTLENHNINCWIAPRNVEPGEKYARAIIKGIKESKLMVLIFSYNSNLSEHVANEIEKAFNLKKTIIPFIVDETPMNDELDYFLARNHRLVAYPDFKKSLDNLVVAVNSNLNNNQWVDTTPLIDIKIIKSRVTLENLISDFSSTINGMISIRDLHYLYEAQEVAYVIVPLDDSEKRLENAFELLNKSLELGVEKYKKYMMYIKFSEQDNLPLMNVLRTEISNFIDMFENKNVEANWSLAPSGIRSELFVIMSR